MTVEEKVMKELESIKSSLSSEVLESIKNEQWVKDNQEALDDLLSDMKSLKKQNGFSTNKKTFKEVFADKIQSAFESKVAEFKAFQTDKDAKITIDLKDASAILSSSHLTGDPMLSYSQRQGLVPAQKINFRDLIPSQTSPTGTYVTYRETGGEGSIGDQTEGQTKSKIDYKFTEIRTVTGYIAGTVDFSKQMLRHLTWLQTTLTRLLLRDFYKKENSKFFQAVISPSTGGNGFNTSLETDDIKTLIDILSGRADEDFNNSFVICSNKQIGRLLKLLYYNQEFAGAASVFAGADGSVRISNIPFVGVSWATDDKVVVIDSDFIERVEAESLSVTFSYENNDNFEKNLVSAKVECQEDLNLLRRDAHSVLDMGNVSS